jgi:hypothetical protein
MKIKFNWGTGIFITIIVMVSWIGFLISKTFEYKINMDSDDYYERGLDHTSQMNRIERSIPYKNDLSVEFVGDYLQVNYPSFFEGKNSSGELWFYRPSDFELDKKIALTGEDNNSQKIHIQHFKKGKYILRVTLEAEDLSYFFEHEILIK